jgi:glyoxalase family protein
MQQISNGIHHVTAIASDAQRNLDFYAGLLGLRLVKQTVNFDDPSVYHFYYGDEVGRPGTLLTFFPIPGARRGRPGTGQATATAFAVPEGSLPYWADRLARLAPAGPERRFGEEVLTFYDPDGLRLELVATREAASLPGWSGGPVPAEHAIRAIYGVTLTLEELEPTVRLLTREMGFRLVGQEGNRYRYAVDQGGPSQVVDLIAAPGTPRGLVAAGSVHHVAWRAPSDEAQQQVLHQLRQAGYHVTPVQDRQYFHSIYFREPGGVLFEIATDPPGFAIDEPVSALGTSLKLPPWLEPHRAQIRGLLPDIRLPGAGREE